jgi:type II secretory pathway pseudopilin PulG
MVWRRLGNEQHGAALLLVLVLVVILGLTAAMAGQSWRATMQRARETELLWRGQQYRQAIESYYNVEHGPQRMFPSKLDDLVRDPRSPGVIRHLRRLYLDPMTGEDWVLVKDPAERIIGVRSSSELEPFKQDGFPEEFEDFKEKTSYKEWEFVYKPPRKKSGQTQQQTSQPEPNTQPQAGSTHSQP